MGEQDSMLPGRLSVPPGQGIGYPEFSNNFDVLSTRDCSPNAPLDRGGEGEKIHGLCEHTNAHACVYLKPEGSSSSHTAAKLRSRSWIRYRIIPPCITVDAHGGK